MHHKRPFHHGPMGPGGPGPWHRRMAKVPKGFLRHYVLRLLSEKPMSGSEIMSEISERTEQRWEPSPGSVYPLLSWLHESGYIRPAEGSELGIKRYELTDSGKEFLHEHDSRHPDFDDALGYGPFFDRMRGLPEEAHDLLRSFRRIRGSSWKLLRTLRKNYSEEVVKEAKAAVDEFIRRIEDLADSN